MQVLSFIKYHEIWIVHINEIWWNIKWYLIFLKIDIQQIYKNNNIFIFYFFLIFWYILKIHYHVTKIVNYQRIRIQIKFC